MKVRDGLNKSIQKSEFLQVRENQLVRINKLAEKVIEKGSCDELNALGAIQRLRDSIDLEFSESVEFSQDRTISNLAMTCEAVATYSSYQNGMESLAEVNDRALVGVMTFVDSHITKMDRDDYWANESHQRCDEPERKELDDLDLCDGKRRDWDNRDDVVVTTELPQKGTFVEISHNQDQGVKVKLVGKEGCNTELLNQSCSELRKVFTDERVRFSAVELVKPRCA
jgi:hypothetical protein